MCVYLSAMCGDRAAAKHRPVLFAAQKKSNTLGSYKRLAAVADASERSAADAAYSLVESIPTYIARTR